MLTPLNLGETFEVLLRPNTIAVLADSLPCVN